jgi:hypothetical protein
VWFKEEPETPGGAERWVSPASFTAVSSEPEAILDVRAQLAGPDAAGDVSATWTASHPAVLAVSSREGHQVELRLRRPGRTTLRVNHASGLAVLVVRAVHDGQGWRVDVSQ